MIDQARTPWFTEFAERLGTSVDLASSVIAEVKLDDAQFKRLRASCLRYIHKCLDQHGTSADQSTLLKMAAAKLANRTPNGILLPKQEVEAEFNNLHRDVAEWLSSLGVDDLVDQAFCPITLRLVKGLPDPAEDSRPYASVKLHADVWAGEPTDSVNIHIPILGDLERTGVHFFVPPDNFEKDWLRPLKSYNEGIELEALVQKIPIQLRFGCAYFAAATALHKTIKSNGGERLILEFRFRRKGDKPNPEAVIDTDRGSNYINLYEWYQLGTTKYMHFEDTYADAKRQVFRNNPYSKTLYSVVNNLRP